MKSAIESVIFASIITLTLFVGGCQPTDQVTSRTLRIWQTEVNPGAIEVLEDVIRELERRHPGVNVELESVSWGALSSKLGNALAAKSPPDISHVQPFMVASLHANDLLVPLDDVIETFGEDDIYPAVLNLQEFEGHRYGLAYAMGVTYFSYRRDIVDSLDLTLPSTWQEYVQYLATLKQAIPDADPILLPGGSPFFIDQLAAELLASNGGRLFDENNRPAFTEHTFIEMLHFYKEMAQYAPSDWLNDTYVDQFRDYATGRGLNVPVTYARAALQIDRDATEGMNDPDHFAVMVQPTGPSGEKSYATLDAEPWVVFKASPNQDLAKDFLRPWRLDFEPRTLALNLTG